MTPDGRTPVVVVTGFLGSGKTTLVNKLVSRFSESLVILNELGEVPVDHLLVESSTEKNRGAAERLPLLPAARRPRGGADRRRHAPEALWRAMSRLERS